MSTELPTPLALADGHLLQGVEAEAAARRGAHGHYAVHRVGADGRHEFLRDPLGVHKRFFACGADGQVHSSPLWHRLLAAGHAPEAVWSVPPGHRLVLDPADGSLTAETVAALPIAMEGAPDDEAPARIRTRLEAVFQAMAPALVGRPVYLALSGGLDSSVIALHAARHLPGATAVTFAMGEPGTAEASEDLETAGAVAAALGLPFHTVIEEVDGVLGRMEEALLHGQDFRDFNVHCALVNAALAAGIARHHAAAGGEEVPVVLTGDTMNELTADYRAETYRGQEYYRLPRLPLPEVRRLLVVGLDAGDREVGIFAAHGIETVQPYALCPDAWTSMPPAMLAREDAKQELVRTAYGGELPGLVFDRPKTRAQSGSADNSTGTLAACVDHGWDSAAVRARFAALHGIDEAALGGFIRGGRYRFRTT